MALGAGAGYFAGAKAAADNALAHRRIDEQAREFDMNAFQRERQMDMQDRQQRAANERADRAFAAQEEQRAIQNGRADRDFDFRREQQGIANDRADRAFDFQREQFDAGQRRAGEEMDFRRAQADRQNERQDWLDTWQGAKMQQDMEAQDLRLREANDLYEEARRLRADNDRQRQARESLSQSAHGMLVRSIVENGGHRPTDEAMQVFNQAMGTDYTGAVMGDGGEVMFLRKGQNPDGTENPFSVDPNTFISSDNVRMVMDAVYGAGGHGYGGGRPSRGASGSGDGMTPYQQGRLDLGARRLDRQERKDLLDDFRADLNALYKDRESATGERLDAIDREIADIKEKRDKVRRGIDPYAEGEKPKDGEAGASEEGGNVDMSAFIGENGKFDLDALLSLKPETYQRIRKEHPELGWPDQVDKFKRRIASVKANRSVAKADGRGEEFDPTAR